MAPKSDSLAAPAAEAPARKRFNSPLMAPSTPITRPPAHSFIMASVAAAVGNCACALKGKASARVQISTADFIAVLLQSINRSDYYSTGRRSFVGDPEK